MLGLQDLIVAYSLQYLRAISEKNPNFPRKKCSKSPEGLAAARGGHGRMPGPERIRAVVPILVRVLTARLMTNVNTLTDAAGKVGNWGKRALYGVLLFVVGAIFPFQRACEIYSKNLAATASHMSYRPQGQSFEDVTLVHRQSAQGPSKEPVYPPRVLWYPSNELCQVCPVSWLHISITKFAAQERWVVDRCG